MRRLIFAVILCAFSPLLLKAQGTPERIIIPFKVAIAAFDPLRPRAFVVPAGTNKLEVVNLEAGPVTGQYAFDFTPVSIAITPNGRRMYVALSKGHEYYTGGLPHVGYVVEFDLEEMTLTKQMELPIDPADIVATDSGLLIISDGSDQWTEVGVFRADTGMKVGTSAAYMGMQLVLHPSQQFVYGTDISSSPSDIHHFTLTPTGGISARWDSPYHGDYPLGQDVFVFPDGSGVFSRYGTVLTSTTEVQTDLNYLFTLGFSNIRSVAFETNRNIMAAVNGETLTFFDYQSRLVVDTRSAPGSEFVGMCGNRAAVLSVHADQTSEIRFFKRPALSIEENTAPTIELEAVNPVPVARVESAFELRAEGWDEDGIVKLIKIYQGTNEIAALTDAPLTTSAIIRPGTNEFYAVAYDSFDATATSRVVRVFGNLPPTVQITEPANDLIFHQTLNEVVLRIEANDPGGSLAEVILMMNGQPVATNSTAPFEFKFTPQTFGRYSFNAEVEDNHGEKTLSAARNVSFVRGLEDNLPGTLGTISGASFDLNASTTEATREKGESLHAGTVGGKSVWCAWRAPGPGTAVIETRGSDFDTLLAVYTLPVQSIRHYTNLVFLTANDDNPLDPPTSRVKFTVTHPTVYFIAVDGREGVAGYAHLSIRFTPAGGGPVNNMLGSAIVLNNQADERSSAGATKEAGEPDHAGNQGGASLWWRFDNTILGTTPIQISTRGSSFDTLLAVYITADPKRALFPAMSDLQLVAANDDEPDGSGTSLVTFVPQGYNTYWVAVDGFNGAEGNVKIALTRPFEPAVRPINDSFTNARLLTGSAVITNQSTRLATRENTEPQHAGKSGEASVWYRWIAPSSGPVSISTKASDFDTLLAVYKGSSLGTLTPVASNDDDPLGLQTSTVIFVATAGTEYRIAVAGYQKAVGNLVLALNQTPALAPRLITQWVEGKLSVGVAEGAGTFGLESSTDLIHWEPVRTLTNEERLELAPSANAASQFYRVRVQER